MTSSPKFRVCRICDWPTCLDPEAAERLRIACEYAVRGEAEPDPDLTDYRVLHGCVEPPPGWDEPDELR